MWERVVSSGVLWVVFIVAGIGLMAATEINGWQVPWAADEQVRPARTPLPGQLPGPAGEEWSTLDEIHYEALIQRECEFTRMIIDAEWLTDEERQEKAWFLANNCR